MADDRPSLLRQTLSQDRARYWHATVRFEPELAGGRIAVHVSPVDDVRRHVLDTLEGGCWCRPEHRADVPALVNANGVEHVVGVWLHRASDGNELSRDRLEDILRAHSV